MSLREQILACQDIQSERVEMLEWGVTLEVRGMTALQRARFLQESIDAKGKVDMEKLYPELAIMSIFNPETGEQVFTNGDREELNQKSGAALERIAQVAMRLSGLTAEAIGEAKKDF